MGHMTATQPHLQPTESHQLIYHACCALCMWRSPTQAQGEDAQKGPSSTGVANPKPPSARQRFNSTLPNLFMEPLPLTPASSFDTKVRIIQHEKTSELIILLFYS